MTADALVNITEGVLTKAEALEHRKSILLKAIEAKDFKAANTALDAFDGKLDLNPEVIKRSINIKTTQTDYNKLLEENQVKQIEQGNDKT